MLGILAGVAGGLAPMIVGAQTGLVTGMVIVSLPCWLVASLLVACARRPFLATIAVVATE